MFEACTCTVIAEGEVSPVIAANASLTNPVVLAAVVDPRRSVVNGGQSTWQKPMGGQMSQNASWSKPPSLMYI